MAASGKRRKPLKRVAVTAKVEVRQGEVFAFDPNKKYLLIVKSKSIGNEQLKQISSALQRKFGNTFTLAVPPDTEFKAVEAEPSETAQEEMPDQDMSEDIKND